MLHMFIISGFCNAEGEKRRHFVVIVVYTSGDILSF